VTILRYDYNSLTHINRTFILSNDWLNLGQPHNFVRLQIVKRLLCDL
jgi:hypothetical protein